MTTVTPRNRMQENTISVEFVALRNAFSHLRLSSGGRTTQALSLRLLTSRTLGGADTDSGRSGGAATGARAAAWAAVARARLGLGLRVRLSSTPLAAVRAAPPPSSLPRHGR